MRSRYLVIKRAPNLQTICGVLIANLALADLLVTALSIPLMISVLSQDVAPVCSVSTVGVTSMVILRCSITASVLILAAMSLDRCWAICSPITHKLKMSTSKLKAFLGLIWMTSLVFSALELYSRFERLFSLYIRTFGAVTCLLAIVISGIVTFTTVRFKSSKIRQLHDNQSHMKISGELREREKQVAKTVALIVGLFCLCWVPIITIPVIFPKHYSMWHFWSGLLALSNSAFNPCVYFYRQRNFRHAFKEMVLPMYKGLTR